MPRLVRRTPLWERIKASLDPYDFLLWLAEQWNDDAYDEWLKAWVVPIGVALNVGFVLARGASKAGQAARMDDVFGDVDARHGSGWLARFGTSLVYILTMACCANALFTFLRKRKYRLFEQPVDIAPATPSAHRVRVDSSPRDSSPLRYLQDMIKSATTSSQSEPDAQREVWEVSVWDPKPGNLTLFTLFSPGHLLLYFSLLPPAPLDPRPSVTVVTALGFGALLSLQLIFLKSSFTQQAKDSTLIHGEVMIEYDTKFVKPSLNRPVRDVATQTRESGTSLQAVQTREVDTYTPTTIINRGFRVNPNPNYASQYDPLHQTALEDRTPHNIFSTTPSLITPTHRTYPNGRPVSSYSRPSTGTSTADFSSSPLKARHERTTFRSPLKGDGGNMGVYTNAASPLRKAVSSSSLRPSTNGDADGVRLTKDFSVNGGHGARRRETGRF